MENQNSTPEVSKSLGEQWRSMTDEERLPWVLQAQEKKRAHQALYPDYRYKPVHPRDENGNCIRKPRKPNSKPRVPKAHKKNQNNSTDIIDDLPASFQLLEEDQTFGAGSSTYSPIASPPATPAPLPTQFYRRRSSSVPAMLSESLMYSSMVHPNLQMTRPAKRPSTSMDFTCAGPNTAFADAFNHEQIYAQAQWRQGHRRSISAPGFGELNEAQYAMTYPAGFAPEANPLTPINPDFGNVFERFSWPAGPSSSGSSSFNFVDFTAAMGGRPQHPHHPHLELAIPSTPPTPKTSVPSSSTSTFSHSSESSPLPISGHRGIMIHQPTPINAGGAMISFDVQHLDKYLKNQGTVPKTVHIEDPFTHSENLGFDNILGLSTASNWSEPTNNTRHEFAPYVEEHITEITPPRALNFNELIVDNY